MFIGESSSRYLKTSRIVDFHAIKPTSVFMLGCEKVPGAFNYRPSYDITGTAAQKSAYSLISGNVMQFCQILADGINVVRMTLIDKERGRTRTDIELKTSCFSVTLIICFPGLSDGCYVSKIQNGLQTLSGNERRILNRTCTWMTHFHPSKRPAAPTTLRTK